MPAHERRAVDNRRKRAVPLGEKFCVLLEDHPHTDVIFHSGRGKGKSHGIATALVLIAHRSSKLIVCARQFQNSIRESVKSLLEQKIDYLGLRQLFKITDHEIVHKLTGSRFIFIGLHRAGTGSESIKSLEGADICWIEEARTITDAALEMLIPTIRKPGSWRIWSLNRKDKDDPIIEMFFGDDPPPRTVVIEVSDADNPWYYNTETPRMAEHMRKVNRRRYDYIYGGNYDQLGEARIFENVVIKVHDPPSHAILRLGMDFGATDPNAIVKAFVDHKAKEIYIAQEAYAADCTTDQWALMMATIPETTAGHTIIADSSGKQQIINLDAAKRQDGSNYGSISRPRPRGQTVSWPGSNGCWISRSLCIRPVRRSPKNSGNIPG